MLPSPVESVEPQDGPRRRDPMRATRRWGPRLGRGALSPGAHPPQSAPPRPAPCLSELPSVAVEKHDVSDQPHPVSEFVRFSALR
jgi:hypothetical protein